MWYLSPLLLSALVIACAVKAPSAAGLQVEEAGRGPGPSTPTTQPTASAPTSQPASSQPGGSANAPPPPLSNFHAIVEGRAYRSAQPTPELIEFAVRNHKIKTVINLRGENESEAWYRREREACEKAGLRMIDIRTSASAYPTREALLALFDAFSDPKNEPILMHCKAGSDRSGLAAAVWRMTVLGEDAKTAGGELSIKYGHFRSVHPQLIKTVHLYQARREWIENEYVRPEEGKDDDD